MEFINCNICTADDTRPVVSQNGYDIVQCKHCGLVYVNPRPEADVLSRLYDGYHQRNGKDIHSWSVLMKLIYKECADTLTQVFPRGADVLDIGCGYGHFVSVMSGLGFRASGIDPSANEVSAALQNGLDVRLSTVEDISFGENSFDAVTMFYVLEHLRDPLYALKRAFHILRPNGLLILRVPHTTPIVRALSAFNIKNNLYDAPFHLYDFSPETLRRILALAGFQSILITPGTATLPHVFVEMAVSRAASAAARLIYRTSGRLLGGVSKSAVAVKPFSGPETR
ncbi:class I SAM-dependent methyltransferase [Candidatus Magnetominusculus dajiuhuensis]|uniref:class I SAM-dependent methyltransferase n=1 Tax=Candidatus Magnetominusculus dajiuhuensis TaxID=3137712 RepID=UPI003B43AB53